jgi:hypothetical protein
MNLFREFISLVMIYGSLAGLAMAFRRALYIFDAAAWPREKPRSIRIAMNLEYLAYISNIVKICSELPWWLWIFALAAVCLPMAIVAGVLGGLADRVLGFYTLNVFWAHITGLSILVSIAVGIFPWSFQV